MKKSFFQVSEFWGIQYLQRSNSTKKATTFLSLLFLLLFTNLVSGQSDAPHISSGVTFQWDSSQPTKTSSASIKSITINGAVYNSFKAPSIYELTQVGPNGNNSNAILFNGTTISNSSSNTNWNSSALNAFQDRNLNHYFTSSNNGRNLSGDYAAENTTDSQRQTLTFSNTIASAGSVLAVTERNANNEYHVKIYGFLAGSTTETVLGETFVITDNGTMKGYGGLNEYYQAGMGVNDGSVTPPTTQSSYWLTNRVVENNGTIGVALFHMEDIVTIGSEISKVQLTAATNDHGDGKLFVITLDDENTDDYKDLDDDDDGILDINERNCTFIDTKSASAILADTGVTNETQVLFDNGNNGAQFDAIGDKFIIDLGSIVTAGTVLKMDTRSSSSTEQEYTIEQSNLDGSSTSNTKIFTKSTTSSEVIDYELTKNTRYIKISMTAAKGGILYLDYLEIQGHYVCTNIDTDQDGVPDYLDLDSDNDGISDVIEVGGTDVDKNGKADGDEGTGTTTNGIPATANTGLDLIDSDSDGIPNNLDIDTDNDGIPDNIEGQTSIGYMPPSGIGTTITDINKNGVDDVYEDIPNSLVGLDPVNTDGTDTDDFIDADSDNDGISDMDENGHVNKVPAYTDADGDGLDDNFDDNNDSSTSGTTVNDGSGTGDKITDTSSLDTAYGDEDNDFPGAGNVDYRDLIDSDNDGVPNVYDLDDDNDGILDTEEGFLITPGQPACGLETTFKFNNAYTEETGDGDVTTFLKGEVFRFTNVASGIDALVTIVNFNNVTSIPKFDDNSSNPDSFQPQSSFSLTNIGDQAYVEYKFDFVTAGTTTPVIIPKFIATFNDVDGNNNYGEQNWSSITTDYVLENPTELSINNYGTWITATSGTNEYTNVTNNFPQVNYSTEHNGKSSYSIRLGIIARATGASGNGRQHNVKFACPTNFNDPYTYKTNIDTDGDGIPNTLDLDSDNDGIPDVIEAGGVDANKDGIADGPIGTTTDTKGIPNSASTGIVTINSDNDTIPNYLDIDSDDDGIPDNIEGQTSNDYIAPSGIATSIVDANNNGIDDNYEIIGGNIGLDPVNTDGTDTDDYIDTDSDNDGIDDVSENGDTEIATSGLDTDGDGLDDNFDDNDDSLIAGSTVNDGLGTGDTVIDKATLEAAFDDTDADFNPGNGDLDYRDITDTDGDGVADALDLDNDNDGILDTDELCKNLIINGDFELQDFSSQTEFPDPVNTNPEGTFMGDYNTNTLTGWNYTQNIDGWVGGKSPYWSPNTFANAYHGKQYLDLTGSNQIVINGTTTNYTTNNVLSQTINTVPGKSYTLSFQWGEDVGHWAGSTVTLDVGILDANNGTIHSETLTANTEGIVNGIIGPKTWFSYTHDFIATTTQTTIQFTADPPSLSAGAALDYVSVTDINCSNDTDNDGIPNHLDLDSDNDGIPDVIEAGGIDVNRDGLADDDDDNVDNTGSNGIPTSAGSGATPTNTDADELPNYLDIDSDNDGIPDNIEGQLSDDYIAPSGVATTITDDNDNGIDDNYEIGGNIGLEPVNTDGTDTPDYIDSDSDNDGILDAFENGDTDNIPSGVDTDNDGLDDAFDDNNDFTLVGSTVNDGLGANDKVTDETSLDAAYGDNDNDFPGTGDLDYRDSPDADNDGIPDNVDLDDDNDGILDTDECSEIVDFDVNLNNHDYDSGSYANGSDVQRKFDIDISANAGSYFQNNNIISFDIYYSIPYYGIQGTQSATGNLNNIEINFSAGTFSDSNAEFDDSNFCASTKRIWVAGSFQVEKDGNIMTIQIPNTDFNFCGSGNDPFNIPTLYAGVCDIDNDGIPNHLDLDSDNDGIPDLVEAGGVDINGDGLIDAIDTDGTLIYDANNDGYDDRYATNNSGNPDSDNDGIPNSQDLDSDNDGIPDVVEAGGTDTNGDGRADGFADTDNDGFNDLVDGDVDGTDNSANALIITGSDNGNGTPDSYPNGDNKDNDGFPDFLDLDSDNDGIPDIIEAGGIDNNGDGVVDNATDVDQDGLADIYDQDTTDGPGPDGTNGIALVKTDASGNMISGDGNSIDTDGDGLPNHLDIDSDNDGIPDLTEAGGADTNNDGVVDDLTDADGDGLADVYDTDDDGTPGVEDTTDALLQTAGNDANGNGKADDTEITFVNGYNQNADTDRDGLPNYVDLDSDNDGIADLVEAGGVDTDGNGLVDNINTDGTLKIDTDGDGLDDTYQTNKGGHPIGNLDSDNDDITDYKDLDSDNDGIPDVVEAGGTDVNGDGRADGFIDADNDGFNDLVDGDVNGTDNSANALIITGTDSDNDGKPDTYTTGDNDGDGIPNHLDIDSDNDGITDITEAGGSDANRDGIADDFRDDDKDGFNDLVDGDPTNVLDVTVDTAGANTANALVLTGTDSDNDGKPDTYTTGDFDNDGKLDFLDIDADNDGIPDNIEGQPTRDYVAPSGMATDITDANNNGLDDNYEVGDAFGIAPENTDGTDNVDYLDTDSDNDGILDAVENGDTNNTASGTDSDGDGLDDSFERADIDDAFDVNDEIDIPNKDSLGDEDNDATSIGDVDYRDATSNGIPMITQVYQVGTERWIEITNIGVNDIPANLIKVQLYQNRTADQTGIAPTVNYTVTTVLEGGKSVLFKNATDVISNLAATATEVTNNTLTDIGGANDMITLSSENDATSWENRYDVISNFTDNTSFVRIDQTLVPNKDYDSTEWVVFIKDDITTFSNNTDAISERHAHDPLLSEIIGSDSEANTLLGLHRVNITTNSGTTWSNGFPDRSRYVVVDGNYTHSANRLSARKLEVKENSTLTIDNNLLVVTNDVILTNIDDEIRLAGSSQFIQTHTDATKIYGLGKLLVDQNSTVPSLYRYNYMSSPVTSNNNGSNYTLKSVFKDGTKPLSASSAVLDINFIGGYDGNYNASPIEIARYWFYTFSPSADGRSNWAQRDENATISAGDGFIFKGPGRQQNYTFYGKPNDGNLNVSNVGADQSYLVGNPFASAISAKKFIQDNLSSITGTLYFWQHAGEVSSSAGTSTGHNFAGYIGGYGTRTIDMGVAANATTINDNNGTSGTGGLTYTEPGAFIPIGQGFFIEGDDSNGGPVVFNNSQREFIGEDSGQSVFFKSQKTAAKTTISQESTVQLIKLGMDFLNEDNISLHRQIGVSFNPNNSFAFEKGYDAETYDTGATDIYWKFPSDDTKYVISGVQEITSDLEVPLEITMGYTGEVSITLDEIKNIDATIFILDKVTGNSYEVQSNKAVINLDKGIYTDRFVLAFEPNTTLAVENTIDNLYTNIYADNKNHQLVIANSFDVNITNVKLYNLLGEQVSTWIIKEQNNNHQLNFKKQIPTGIYIVKINTSKGEVNKKIVIE